MLKRALLTLALATTLAVGAFAQTTDPSAALKELNDLRAKIANEAREAGKRADFAPLLARAKELVKGVDVEKIDPNQGMAWAQLFQRAGEHKSVCRAAERYLEANPNAKDKFQAQMTMISACYELEEVDMMSQVIAQITPAGLSESSQLGSWTAYMATDLVEMKKGPKDAIALIDQVLGQLKFESPADYAKTMLENAKANNRTGGRSDEELLKMYEASAAQSQAGVRGTLIERKSELINTSEGKEAALKYLDSELSALAEGSPARRSLSSARARLALPGSAAPTINVERGYGDFKSLEGLKGKVVMLDFFAHWCGPCIAAFPDMKKMYTDLKGQGLEIVGYTTYYGYYKQERNLAPDAEFAKMQDFINEHSLPWPVAYGNRDAFAAYGVSGIPHVVLIDRKGNVRQIKVGYSPETFAKFRKEVEELLKENG